MKIWILISLALYQHAAFGAERKWAKSEKIVTVIRMDNVYFRRNGGFPPPDRNAYLPLIDAIKEYEPKVIFFDFNFTRNALPSESKFAKQVNAKKRLVIPFALSTADYSENYEENRAYFGTRVSAHQLPINNHPNSMPGVIFPYPEIVEQSEKTCAYEITPDKDLLVRSFYPFYYYRNFLFPSATLCILNEYLKDRKLQLILSPDYSELHLVEISAEKIIVRRKVFRFATKDHEQPIPLKIMQPSFFQAQDVQENQAVIRKNQIIIVGPAADGVGSWLQTPNGKMSRLDILASEINTLWQMIKDDIPDEK